jgi:hypothetical protein
MACLYAIENALPAGHVYYVKTSTMDYWKPFASLNTFTTRISLHGEQAFYLLDKICLSKNSFDMQSYKIIHYELKKCPDDIVIENLYNSRDLNFEEFLNAVTDFEPMKAIHYMDTLLENIHDKFYILLRIGDYTRRIMSPDTAIKLHCSPDATFEDYVDYAHDVYTKYCGVVDLDDESDMLWIREPLFSEIQTIQTDPDILVKIITNEVYSATDPHKMRQKISGVFGNLNSTHKQASRQELYHLAKLRLSTDPVYLPFMRHQRAEEFISNKITRLMLGRG